MNGAIKRIYLFIVILSLMISLPAVSEPQSDQQQIDWFQFSGEPVQGIDWRLDGQYIATGNSTENELRIFDWENKNYIWSYTFETSSDSRFFPEFLLRWSPNGMYIASISDGKVYIIDFQSYSLLRIIDVSLTSRDSLTEFPPYAEHIEWSSDSGQLAVLSSDGYIDIISISSGRILQTIDIAIDQNMRGEGIIYQIFDWSPNSLLFAAPYYIPQIPLSGAIGFWDENGQLLTAVEAAIVENQLCPVYGDFLYQIQDLEWANDNRTVAVGGSYGYGLCLLTIDGAIESAQISTSPTSIVVWSPNQRWLASSPTMPCLVFISELIPSGIVSESRITTSNQCSIYSMNWSPDSRYLAVGTDQGLWIGTISYGL